ncbi:Neopullulanase [hydrothermal vent metagenome]|uniref:Neopullulanase n=1 Tax=hydrothermal vent metagenome TaxID=652676 RepID=A0A3B0RLK3_9ZZZZ
MRYFLVFMLALVILPGAAQAQDNIKRVEPPFWWVGFKDSRLQLLVYGDNIAAYDPQVDHKGISLAKVTRVKSPNYLFLDLTIAKGTPAGPFDIMFTHKGGKVIIRAYELKARAKNAAGRKGFDAADAIYLITPDRYANGDAQNDTVAGMKDKLNRAFKGGRHGGDIQGISDHLNYIADMGFTSIWLNPVLENDQPEYSYHGYATTDFYRVDPRYGTNEDFRKMAQKARAMGIGLIMDMIVNHVGSKHWWMADLPTDDWINYASEFLGGKYVNTSHRRTTIQDPYSSASDRKIFSDGWFVESMPDINQRNPLMAQYLIQNAIWWIEYSGLTGIRMDTYPYPDMNFMAEWSRRVMEEYPDFNIVGEEWSVNPSVVSYWQRGKVNKNGYVSYLPSLMDFPLQDAMVTGLTVKEEWADGLIGIYKMLANDVVYPDPSHMVTFPDNHDMNRIFTQLGEDYDLYKMAMAFTLTMRGIPQIYYGTEILMTNPDGKDDGVIRSDFPGGWKGDKVNAFTGRGLTDRQKDAQAFLKNLLNWRKDKAVIHNGKLMHFVPENGVYVYFRYDDQDKVMVVLNKNAKDTDLSLGRFSEILNDGDKATDIITGKKVELSGTLELSARTVMVLDIK